MIKRLNLFFITFLGIGKIKYAPGTVASLTTCILFFIFINFFSFTIIFLITLIIITYSFSAINNSFDKFKSDDPQEIVIDEVAGQLLTLLAIPIYETLYPLPMIYYCIVAFISFRIFDVWKPYPINYVDSNVKGSLGIMLDDIFAAIYSILLLIIIFFFFGG